MVTTPGAPLALSSLREHLAGLRLCEAPALEAIRRSLERHGQLQPITVAARSDGQPDDGHEVVDGFKRMRAARALGWPSLHAVIEDVGVVDAKLRIVEIHEGQRLTELEEGWLVRSLHRDDRLSQGEIAARLGRHKSWVNRRLVLVEALEPGLQLDVRRGLLAVRAAVHLAALPRGNQAPVAELIMRHGMSVRQTHALVTELVAAATVEARAAVLARWSRAPDAKHASPTRAVRSEADYALGDIGALCRSGARLQARLHQGALDALGEQPRELVRRGLEGLLPVLESLSKSVVATLYRAAESELARAARKEVA